LLCDSLSSNHSSSSSRRLHQMSQLHSLGSCLTHTIHPPALFQLVLSNKYYHHVGNQTTHERKG